MHYTVCVTVPLIISLKTISFPWLQTRLYAHKFYNSFFLTENVNTLTCDFLINKHSGQFQEGKLKLPRWIDRKLYVVIVEKIKIHLHKTMSVVNIIYRAHIYKSNKYSPPPPCPGIFLSYILKE